MENQDNLNETTNEMIIHEKDTQSFINQPLNQILYGPPGTGKTYSTTEKAYKIIHGNENYKYEKAKEWFEKELAKDDDDDRQLDFITFHQNYSYEDFIMGIKPDLNPEGGSLGFKRHKGIFYKICQRALKHWDFEQLSEGIVDNNIPSDEIEKNDFLPEEIETVNVSFETVFDELITQPLSNGLEVKIPMTTPGGYFKIFKVADNQIYYKMKNNEDDIRQLTVSSIKKYYESDYIPKLSALNVYNNPLVARLKQLTNTNPKRNIHQAKSSQNNNSQRNSSQKKYVIIIDEINRANISRVFGELITLIEEDKRWGNEHQMEVRLPDGETKFTVPNNLYIIGTMNTADKSIALLDIALRRRFEFTPLYPDSELVDSKYTAFFKKLNDEIKAKKGIDFTIGHSYFMPKKNQFFDFVQVMNSKIIPLLNEYFYSTKDNKTVVELLRKALNLEKFSIDETGFLPKIKML